MTLFDAGVLKGNPGQTDTQVVFHETVHGPVIGYATVNGVRVALSQERSTRGREAVNFVPFMELNENVPSSPQGFIRTMSKLEPAFNWHYADSRHIASFSSARLPLRAPGTDPQLPTVGTGAYDWTGFAPPSAHPQAIDPPGGYAVNWNNRPAHGFGASDDNWAYGSVQRVDLLAAGFATRKKLTPADVVSIMNKAATQDLRAVEVLPEVAGVLKTGPAPSPRAQQMLDLLEGWAAKGAGRLDRDLDGKTDDRGGDHGRRLAEGRGRGFDARARHAHRPAGCADGDRRRARPERLRLPRRLVRLRRQGSPSLLGRPVQAPFRTKFCGGGDLAACRAALWAAFEQAGADLAAVQGPDPAGWRADATKERIRFAPGILTDTMRWANRPTFQQVMSFTGHR